MYVYTDVQLLSNQIKSKKFNENRGLVDFGTRNQYLRDSFSEKFIFTRFADFGNSVFESGIVLLLFNHQRKELLFSFTQQFKENEIRYIFFTYIILY